MLAQGHKFAYGEKRYRGKMEKGRCFGHVFHVKGGEAFKKKIYVWKGMCLLNKMWKQLIPIQEAISNCLKYLSALDRSGDS